MVMSQSHYLSRIIFVLFVSDLSSYITLILELHNSQHNIVHLSISDSLFRRPLQIHLFVIFYDLYSCDDLQLRYLGHSLI